MNSGSTDELHEQCLGLVVAVVSHANPTCTKVSDKLEKVVVAKVPCCRLNALLVQCGVSCGVEVGDVQLDSMLLAQLLAELFVPVTLFASQMEVAVDCLNPVALLE